MHYSQTLDFLIPEEKWSVIMGGERYSIRRVYEYTGNVRCVDFYYEYEYEYKGCLFEEIVCKEQKQVV